MKYSFPVGVLLGGGAMLLAQPSLKEPDRCGVERVKHDVSTAYVLKAPEPSKCAPVDVPAPAACPETISTTDSTETGINSQQVDSILKKKHRRYRRRWRH